jgi:uncharacterized tellurite resistance protein B-like protein
MQSETKKLAFLKALAAIAWADGELSSEELNYLKHLALKFNLSDSAWNKLEPYLEDSISLDEGETLIRDFLSHINSPGEKQELLGALEEMIQADNRITPEEQEFLDKFSQIIQDTSALGIIRDKLKGLLGGTLFKQTAGRSAELADYIHNKLLYKLRQQFARQGRELKSSPEQLNYLTLFGGLLARVAYADGDISPTELAHMKSRLGQLAQFGPDELELMAAVIEDETLKGLDYFRLSSEFFKVSNREQRLQLLDCLFGLAATDQQLLNQEVEEIRSIAYALGLTHKDFIGAKLKHLHKHDPV